MQRRILLVLSTFALALPAAEIRESAAFQNRPAIIVANDKIELTILPLSGAMAALTLREGDPINPMWDAIRNDREQGRPERTAGGTGHFVCVDGFGPVSEEEAAAGLNGHGEAARLPWATTAAKSSGGVAELTQAVTLPRVQEMFTRTLSLRDGENVVRVHSTLESLLSFDRPACWAEHATIGSPFLEPGVTVVDLSANRALVRPRPKPVQGRKHRLIGGDEFEWPNAPLQAGGKVDLRAAPVDHDFLDHTGHLMTKAGPFAWVTALHPQKRLVLGYLFKTSEYPWLQTWENYPAEGMLARGLEFGTQVFDLPRRQMVTENRLFGELLYRWLPAMSKIESTYLMFWASTPEGFTGVSSVELSGGKLTLKDSRSGKTMTLATRQTLD
jgi:hypothetical protein